MIAQALEACHREGGKSTWTRHDLIQQLNAALPNDLGNVPADGVRTLLESLADRALADGGDAVLVVGREIGSVHVAGRLENGRAKHLDPASAQYATRCHLAAEDALLRSCGVRGRTALPARDVTAWLDTFGASLNPAQRQAVLGLATSDAALATLVGPAGTGKSYVAGLLDAAWRDLTPALPNRQPNGLPGGDSDPKGGRVVGVATTQVAADILREDGVGDTANVAAFLAAQARLADGHALPGDEQLRLTSGDLLLVDEASMVDTYALTRLQAAVDTAGARMVLMGDPHQLSAVGSSGMMRAAIDRDAETYTLSDVRRFHADWEREASLQLRDGTEASIPAAVAQYDSRGRLLDGGTTDDAIRAVARAAAADRLAGKDVVVVTGTNEHASAVSAAVRALLVEAGTVAEAGVVLGRDQTPAGVGDLVQARRIDRALGLVNREVYEITAISEDGALDVVCPRTGELHVIPADYVAADVTLAYASTAHGAQGRTADTGHVLLAPGMDRAGAYVGMTRGRESNTAWAVTESHNPDQPTLTTRGILARALTTRDDLHTNPAAGNELAAVDIAAADTSHRSSAATLLALVEEETRVACRERLDRDLDTLTAAGLLTDDDRARLGADQGTEHLSRLLRTYEQAGHNPLDILRDAITSGRSLSDAVSVAQVLATRIHRTHGSDLPAPLKVLAADREDHDAVESDDVTDRGRDAGVDEETAAGRLVPARIDPARAEYIAQLETLLDDRRRELGTALANLPVEELPAWLTSTLGALPSPTAGAEAGIPDPTAATVTPTAVDPYASTQQEWIDRAGTVAALREATGWDHEQIALGRCPGVTAPERRAAWHAGYTAAGMPEERRPEAELTNGRLLVRARAAELAQAAAPAAVYDAQRERHRLADLAAREAVLARAAGREDDAARHDQDAAVHRLLADQLDLAADARARWLVENAETLAAGEAAHAELGRRGISPGSEPDRVTAAEWLAAEAEARAADDAYRTITEADLTDTTPAHETAGEAADEIEPAGKTARTPLELRGGYTHAELDLLRDAADRTGVDLEPRSFVVPDETFPTAEGTPRTEVADVLRDLERDRHAAPTRDHGDDHAHDAVDMTRLAADATALEIAAATARARATLDDAADAASQNATEPPADEVRNDARAADDEWHYLRTRRPADSADEFAAYDTTSARDDAYDAAWDATDTGTGDDTGDVLAAGND